MSEELKPSPMIASEIRGDLAIVIAYQKEQAEALRVLSENVKTILAAMEVMRAEQ